MISIVMPVYNGERYLSEAIQSILSQTYEDFELIIVNDCSTDNTSHILKKYKEIDSRIKIIHNRRNQKLPKSLNIGFERCKGEYLTWTSDDNVLHKEALQIMLDKIKATSADIVWCDYYIINEVGKRIGKTNFGKYKIEEILFRNIIGACFLYRSKVQEKLNGYNHNLFLAEDYDFWLRAYKFPFKFCFINEKVYEYRIHAKSLTGKRKKEIAQITIKLLKKNLQYVSNRMMKRKICEEIAIQYKICTRKTGEIFFTVLAGLLK